MLLSTKAVYFVLHDGLRRYFSEPLQGRRSSLQGLGAGRGDNSTSLRSDNGCHARECMGTGSHVQGCDSLCLLDLSGSLIQ